MVTSALTTSSFYTHWPRTNAHNKFLRVRHTTGPGVSSATNKNEHQGSFRGRKGGRCFGLTLVSLRQSSEIDNIWYWNQGLFCFILVCMTFSNKALFLHKLYFSYQISVIKKSSPWTISWIRHCFNLRKRRKCSDSELFKTVSSKQLVTYLTYCLDLVLFNLRAILLQVMNHISK
jgi:hypothetical protein